MSPFPFFFAVGNYCLLFSSDCTQGFLYKDADMFSYIKNEFYSKIKESTELAVFPKDMFEVKNIVSCNIKSELEITLTRYPCLAPIADADFIYSILNQDVPGIQQLAELAVYHYANAFGKDTEKYIIHESGIVDDWDVEINTSAADMDENGVVDDWDGVLLARKLAGWNV